MKAVILALALLALASERDASPNSLLVECGEGMSRAFFQAAMNKQMVGVPLG